MARQITAKGGPLDGKQFLVHETAERLDEHPGVTGGHYKVNDKTATWQANGKAASVKPGRTAPATNTVQAVLSPGAASDKTSA